MRPITDALVLRIWEEGATRHGLDRALTVLAHACPESDWEALAMLPIGRRDAQLLSLHEAEFGPEVQGVGVCPECRQRLSFGLRIEEIRMPATGSSDHGVVVSGSYRVAFRLPDSFDLAAAAATRDMALAKSAMLARCVLEAERDGVAVGPSDLPVSVVDELAAAMAAADPQSEVECRFQCMDCRSQWTGIFDIAAFVWEQFANRARALIGEIHALASAYGWSESEILGMSAARRRLYLQRVGDV